MAGRYRIDTEEFIRRAVAIHQDRYDYSKAIYINANTKVKIICRVHGEFEQLPYDHMYGFGCRLCAQNVTIWTKEQFIERASEIHRGKYSYSQIEFSLKNTKLKIECPTHGYFYQLKHDHLSNKAGCPACKTEKIRKRLTYSREKVIKNFKKVHGDCYDYSKVDYINDRTKVCIICREHGEFWQTPMNHLRLKENCPVCSRSESSGERKIREFLEKSSIKFKAQAFIGSIRIGTNNKFHFDFYLPDYNLCIEYDGIQHFKPVDFFGGEKNYKDTVARDSIKNYFCEREHINLIRIPYWEYNGIEKILSSVLSKERLFYGKQTRKAVRRANEIEFAY